MNTICMKYEMKSIRGAMYTRCACCVYPYKCYLFYIEIMNNLPVVNAVRI